MHPRPRILHVLEATVGGTRRHLIDLLLHLGTDRFAPCCACSTRRDPAFAEDLRRLEDAGVKVLNVPMTRSIAPAQDLLSLLRLRGILQRERFDLVHTHSSKAGFAGRLAARLTRVPHVVHTPHVFAFDTLRARPSRALYRFLERRAAVWSERIVCVSRRERHAALQAGIAEGKLVVIPNGIAPRAGGNRRAAQIRSALGIPPQAPVIGAVGRLCRQKGHRDALLAARELLPCHPDLHWIFVGDGELRERLSNDARRWGLDRLVHFAGEQRETEDWYDTFDVFCLPSLWEGMPYALLEAMAARRAIVATRVGGIPEAVRHGESALLTAAGDPQALAREAHRLLADEALRLRMGAAAAHDVQRRFRLEDMIEAYRKLYASLLTPPGGPC